MGSSSHPPARVAARAVIRGRPCSGVGSAVSEPRVSNAARSHLPAMSPRADFAALSARSPRATGRWHFHVQRIVAGRDHPGVARSDTRDGTGGRGVRGRMGASPATRSTGPGSRLLGAFAGPTPERIGECSVGVRVVEGRGKDPCSCRIHGQSCHDGHVDVKDLGADSRVAVRANSAPPGSAAPSPRSSRHRGARPRAA